MAPVFMEIRDYVIKRIKNQTLKVGDRLPTERELEDLFNVSRMTVRRAIDKLVEDGVLVRMVGKGTFVASERIHTRLNVLKSFSEEIKEYGHKPTARLLSTEVVDCTCALGEKLNVNSYTRLLKVIRLRLVDGLEMSVTTSYFPLLKALMLDDIDFTASSIYEQIEEKLGLKIEKAEEVITASLDLKAAALLRVSPKTPLLNISRLTLISNNVPIEYMEGLFRPDRYVVYQELFR